jgi:hypothetical protein
METDGRQASLAQLLRQRHREQHVGSLALSVRDPAVVVLPVLLTRFMIERTLSDQFMTIDLREIHSPQTGMETSDGHR